MAHTNYQLKKNVNQWLLLAYFLLIISLIFAIKIGQFQLSKQQFIELFKNLQSPQELSAEAEIAKVILAIRLPRVILAILVGAGLAISGSVMQACIQNPLADPYLLGVSSGATAGATFSLLFGSFFSTRLGTPVFAFMGGIIATLTILRLSAKATRNSLTVIVLAGVVINVICQSMTSLFIYLASNSESVKNVNFWTMGSLAGADWHSNLLVLSIGLPICFYFIHHHQTLNLLMMGAETAATLGINTQKQQQHFMILAAALTALMVSQCGVIAFIGLIIPHISRSLVGVNHQKMLHLSIVLGAILLLWSDTIARLVIPNGELPIGIITSLVGAPVFMVILLKKQKERA